MIHLNKIKPILLLTIALSIFSCKDDCEDKGGVSPTETSPNILLIIADDMGKDATNGFSEGNIKPNTPHIDAFKTSGLSFNNFWAYPTCSPTRSSILTGKYGYRTGVKWASDELSQSEKSLQTYINENTNDKYATAIAGKWHLSGSRGNFNPEVFGIDYYAGLIRGQAQSYYGWLLTEDGVGNIENEYATTKFTDLGIDWINNQDKSWFMWMAYNAPHTPFHVPPAEMHNQGNLPEFEDGMDEMPYYIAAIEAMDYQIGRLLDSIPPEELENTIIIFIGDNGSPNEVAQAPYSSRTAKGSLYQGGINVPMFVTGKGVSRTGEDNNLVASSDLFATIAELAGVSVNQINDSKSFKSLLSEPSVIREFQYSEKDNGTIDNWTLSNGDYKIIVDKNGREELYNLRTDPYESDDLMLRSLSTEENAAKAALETELAEIRN